MYIHVVPKIKFGGVLMKQVRIELTKCPSCGATCVVGSDEDFQEFCAACKASFMITKIEVVTNAEYKERMKNAKERFFHTGWVAFKP